jgi:hypothetical protein
MPQSSTLYIELDVHQEIIPVASVAKGHNDPYYAPVSRTQAISVYRVPILDDGDVSTSHL